MWSLHFSCLL
uniref:Uncharacterized protein n=1 Tax=Anguilla anguilla TaxID=7936 RepID=A0A0E9PW04_ANGAN